LSGIYNGSVTTDGHGAAVITLPEYFAALNRDFRHQLTAIGQFAPAIAASEIADRRFTIQTDKPNVKVYWQATGKTSGPTGIAFRLKKTNPKASAAAT